MTTEASPSGGEYPVLIAGGGLVGLSMAMFLAQHGVASLAIERLIGGSPLPRAGHFHLRTLELFRSAGIEDEVRERSFEDFVPEGAIIAMDNLCGRKLADIIPSLNEGVEPLSPCRRLFINQPSLEKVLRRRAAFAGAQVLEGHEIVNVAQDTGGVTVTVKNLATGATRSLHGHYLVAADGAHSRVRELLDIPYDGRGIFSNSMTIYFRANLAPQLLGKPLSVIYFNNATFGGFMRTSKDCQSGFIGVNTVGDPKVDPVAAANAAGDTSEPRLIEIVRAAAGVPDLPVEIVGVARWRATSDVARKFHIGRISLVGDAAHLMPPNGGFGGNTGIHDAHNLAWKIALVLKGVAGPGLVETYEAERKPVSKFTVEQAYSRYVTRTATYLGAKDYEPVVNDFNIELGYLYRSGAVVSEPGDDGKVHDDPRQTVGRPGSRAPHVWLERGGQRLSSLDLYGKDFVLMAGRDGDSWVAAAEALARGFPGLGLRAYRVGADLRDPDGQFEQAYGLTTAGAALVRPDGFVAWRAQEMPADPAGALAAALYTVLMRS
jgi:2-polyprenyl-6-methoxyphenol hydroxylase-like FAD-dependent oxidoreductase